MPGRGQEARFEIPQYYYFRPKPVLLLYAVCCMLLLRGLDVCMLASKTQQYTERCGRSLRNRVFGISADLLRTMYRFLLGSRQA